MRNAVAGIRVDVERKIQELLTNGKRNGRNYDSGKSFYDTLSATIEATHWRQQVVDMAKESDYDRAARNRNGAIAGLAVALLHYPENMRDSADRVEAMDVAGRFVANMIDEVGYNAYASEDVIELLILTITHGLAGMSAGRDPQRVIRRMGVNYKHERNGADRLR